MVWDPLHGECQELHGICIQDEVITPLINVWASTLVQYPPYCELTISRMKRGGVGVIAAGHIL